MTNIEEVLADSGHNCKVRRETSKHLEQIAEYKSAGCSNAAIYRKLKSEGHDVGSPTGFNNTLRYFKGELDRMMVREAADRVQATEAAAGFYAAHDSSYVDNRNTNQVGRS
jgi:hypothetical protein